MYQCQVTLAKEHVLLSLHCIPDCDYCTYISIITLVVGMTIMAFCLPQRERARQRQRQRERQGERREWGVEVLECITGLRFMSCDYCFAGLNRNEYKMDE